MKEDVAANVDVLVSDRVKDLLPPFAAPTILHVHEVWLQLFVLLPGAVKVDGEPAT